jgi:SAM-dependent methyltransferase
MIDREGDGGSARSYVLGHSDGEIERLKAQARCIDPITRRFFREAGVGPDMRVLEVGSGAGDVALLVADIVGAGGEVVGVDRVASALEVARSRVTARSLRNVEFREGDAAEMSFERPFDVVLGRYVLQFQPDPAAMLRKLARHVRPGGLVVFHEIDWGGVGSDPPVPTYDHCCRWVEETIRRGGAATRMRARLHAAFVDAGLGAPEMRLEALLGGGAHGADLIALVVGLVATLLPRMEALGIATTADVGLDTLGERMMREVATTGSVVVGHWQVAAWVRR